MSALGDESLDGAAVRGSRDSRGTRVKWGLCSELGTWMMAGRSTASPTWYSDKGLWVLSHRPHLQGEFWVLLFPGSFKEPMQTCHRASFLDARVAKTIASFVRPSLCARRVSPYFPGSAQCAVTWVLGLWFREEQARPKGIKDLPKVSSWKQSRILKAGYLTPTPCT